MHYSPKREKLLDKIVIMVYNIYSLLTLIFKAKSAEVSTFLHHLQCSLGYCQEIFWNILIKFTVSLYVNMFN